MKIITDLLNRWSPWRLRDEHAATTHHLSLCVDALTRIYNKSKFLGLDNETTSLMARALAISDPEGNLGTLHFREGYVEVAHPAFYIFAEMFIKDFEKTGAENYISTVFTSAKHGEIEVLAQIVHAMTPAQKNTMLDAEILRLNLEIQSLKGTP